MESFKEPFLKTTPFTQTKNYAVVQALAQKPFDLTDEKALTEERITSMQTTQDGLKVLYGFQKVTQETMKALFSLAQERRVFEQMKMQFEGKAVSFIEGYPCDNRPVLHTAMRDIFEPLKQDAPEICVQARRAIEQEHVKLKEFLHVIEKEGRFSEMIFVGIGGSELGPKTLFLSLNFYHRRDRKVHFVNNVDPDDVAQTLLRAKLEKTLVVVISKSGTTIETATNEEFLRSEFVKRGLDPKEHFVSVTTPHTPMDDHTRYRKVFYIWDYVGGRFSASSLVGGLLISFGAGYEHYVELLRGAHAMDILATKHSLEENIPLLLALLGIWNHNFLHYPTFACVPYSQMLFRFPAHLQQCDMESNGKCIDRMGNSVSFETGPIVWGEPGTNAQHSFYQLIHQGTTIVPLDLIGFIEPQGGHDFELQGTTSQEKLICNLAAQALALACGKKSNNPNTAFPGNRPSTIILAKRLTPYVVGQLLALYEHKIAFQGYIWGINSFDQEGVQLGKTLADKLLLKMKSKRTHEKTDPFPLGEALLKAITSV